MTSDKVAIPLGDDAKVTDRGWATLSEFSRIVGISYVTALKYRRAGFFAAVRVGGHWRVYDAEIRRFINEGNKEPPYEVVDD